jgi:methionyl-tRNA formyltransferase
MSAGRAAPWRVAFVGDRTGVFDAIADFPELRVEWIWAVAGSRLERRLAADGRACKPFRRADAPRVVDELAKTSFEILVSNGCPIILPIARLASPQRIFLNVHPSLLPDLRGLNPINGAMLLERGHAGATLHHMNDGIDAGAVVDQQRVEITDDLDLGLLYHLVFRLEADVFRSGMRRLIDSGFALAGAAQPEQGTYYSGRARDSEIDPAAMDDDEIARRVRSFGVRSQGVRCRLEGRRYRVFEARIVRHPSLLAEFEALPAGSLALAYDGKLLVRTRQGLVDLVSFEEETEEGPAR